MITLHIEVNGGISAEFGKSAEREHILGLFGTTRIPTPFTFNGIRPDQIEHWAAAVITQIRAKNPGEVVEWSAERCEEFVAFKFAKSAVMEAKARR
jgi:hypothetical protein